jgi:hypothetical protein
LFFVGVLIVGAALRVTPAQGQSNAGAAVVLFDEGRAALQKGELDVACAKFRESDRLAPAIGTSFNLANCEEQRGRLATAWILFRQVAARMKPDDPRLPVANERLSQLEKRVPRVVFASDGPTPKETRVRLDDIELESASFGSAIPLDPGGHRAIIRSPQAEPRSVVFTVEEAETMTISLSAPAAPAAPPSSAAGPVDPHRASEQTLDDRVLGIPRADAFWISAGVGAAGLLMGAVTGVVGLNAEAKGDKGCDSASKTCSQEGYDANQRAKSMAVLSTLGFAVGILGASAATYIYVSAPEPGSKSGVAIVGVAGKW